MTQYINYIPEFLKNSKDPKLDFWNWYSKNPKGKLFEMTGEIKDIKINELSLENLRIDTNYIWIDKKIAVLYQKTGCIRIRTDRRICDKPIYLGECCKNCCILFGN